MRALGGAAAAEGHAIGDGAAWGGGGRWACVCLALAHRGVSRPALGCFEAGHRGGIFISYGHWRARVSQLSPAESGTDCHTSIPFPGMYGFVGGSARNTGGTGGWIISQCFVPWCSARRAGMRRGMAPGRLILSYGIETSVAGVGGFGVLTNTYVGLSDGHSPRLVLSVDRDVSRWMSRVPPSVMKGDKAIPRLNSWASYVLVVYTSRRRTRSPKNAGLVALHPPFLGGLNSLRGSNGFHVDAARFWVDVRRYLRTTLLSVPILQRGTYLLKRSGRLACDVAVLPPLAICLRRHTVLSMKHKQAGLEIRHSAPALSPSSDTRLATSRYSSDSGTPGRE